MKVGVLGASGYAGAELLRLCAGHPNLDVEVVGADTQAGVAVAELYPSLSAAYPDRIMSRVASADADGLDLVFLALPQGVAAEMMEGLRSRVGAVVDLSADFRLRDPAAYPVWYGAAHPAPHLLELFAYGLPELFRDELESATLVAAPGCYVTAAALALAPLVRHGLIEPAGVVVDAASGVSGAGRSVRESTQFTAVDGDFVAYGLLDHRHTPEIEQATGASVLFTPHLAPMSRGILATCYARPATEAPTEDILEFLRRYYEGEPFVSVSNSSPSPKAARGSNAAHLTARYDTRTGWIVILAALDNLVKGAAGQAVQCANILLGLPETTGLGAVGVYP